MMKKGKVLKAAAVLSIKQQTNYGRNTGRETGANSRYSGLFFKTNLVAK